MAGSDAGIPPLIRQQAKAASQVRTAPREKNSQLASLPLPRASRSWRASLEQSVDRISSTWLGWIRSPLAA